MPEKRALIGVLCLEPERQLEVRGFRSIHTRQRQRNSTSGTFENHRLKLSHGSVQGWIFQISRIVDSSDSRIVRY